MGTVFSTESHKTGLIALTREPQHSVGVAGAKRAKGRSLNAQKGLARSSRTAGERADAHCPCLAGRSARPRRRFGGAAAAICPHQRRRSTCKDQRRRSACNAGSARRPGERHRKLPGCWRCRGSECAGHPDGGPACDPGCRGRGSGRPSIWPVFTGSPTFNGRRCFRVGTRQTSTPTGLQGGTTTGRSDARRGDETPKRACNRTFGASRSVAKRPQFGNATNDSGKSWRESGLFIGTLLVTLVLLGHTLCTPCITHRDRQLAPSTKDTACSGGRLWQRPTREPCRRCGETSVGTGLSALSACPRPAGTCDCSWIFIYICIHISVCGCR